jgi:hypothetical protein
MRRSAPWRGPKAADCERSGFSSGWAEIAVCSAVLSSCAGALPKARTLQSRALFGLMLGLPMVRLRARSQRSRSRHFRIVRIGAAIDAG